MTISQIAESDMLWSHRFQLLPGLKAGADQQSNLFIENFATGDRFILNRWQMAIMTIFDRNDSTVAQAVNEIFPSFPNELDEATVRQFCQWLISEGLVLDPAAQIQQPASPVAVPQPAPAPELELLEEPPINPIARAVNASRKSKKKRSGFLKRTSQIAACLAVGIGTWKFTAEVWPTVQGPLQDTRSFIASKVIEKESHSSAIIPAPQQIELPAGEVDESDLDTFHLLQKLRKELLDCQARRDTCYQDNDEDGYRNEVHKIAQLTHRIGEIQANAAAEKVKSEQEEKVAFGS